MSRVVCCVCCVVVACLVHPDTDAQLDVCLTHIRERLYEVEHMQIECLYHIINLVEWKLLSSEKDTTGTTSTTTQTQSNIETLVQVHTIETHNTTQQQDKTRQATSAPSDTTPLYTTSTLEYV